MDYSPDKKMISEKSAYAYARTHASPMGALGGTSEIII